MIADIAYNMSQGLGPASFVDIAVEKAGGNKALVAPAHFWLMSLWLFATGLSRESVVCYSIGLFALAAYIMWRALVRRNGLGSPTWRLAAITCFLISHPALKSYGVSRYDAVGSVALASTMLALTSTSGRTRSAAIFACGIITALSGIHVSVSMAILAALGSYLFACVTRRDLATCWLGLAVGGAINVLIMHWGGTWEYFLTNLEVDNVKTPDSIYTIILAPLRNQSSICMLASLALCLVMRSRPGSKGLDLRVILFGLMAGLCIPWVLIALGRYSPRYEWVVSSPMLFTVFHAASRCAGIRSAFAIIIIGVAASALKGMPLTAARVIAEWDRNSPLAPYAEITSQIRGDDVIFADYSAYYPLKNTGAHEYFGQCFWVMSTSEKARVNVMVLEGDGKGEYLNKPSREQLRSEFGGEWDWVADIKVERGRLRQKLPPAPREQYLYDWQVYRRK
jgi:hypothetical protein